MGGCPTLPYCILDISERFGSVKVLNSNLENWNFEAADVAFKI